MLLYNHKRGENERKGKNNGVCRNDVRRSNGNVRRTGR